MTIWKQPPLGYPVLSYCAECGRDFTGDKLFDRHRIGTHDYTYSEGLKLDPPRENGRRCRTPEEMEEMGWWCLSDEERLESSRDRLRAGYGVELWTRPGAHRSARPAAHLTS